MGRVCTPLRRTVNGISAFASAPRGTPRSLWILLPFASITVLWITVGDRDGWDPVAGASGHEAAQQRIVDRLGLEVPPEDRELEFKEGDLTCSVDRVPASANEVERAAGNMPRRVARNRAGDEGVMLASGKEDVAPAPRRPSAGWGAPPAEGPPRPSTPGQAAGGGGRNSVPSGTSKPVRTALS